MIIFSLRLIVTYCTLNSYVHPASHSFPIDTSDPCVILGMMCPPNYSSGNSGKSSIHELLDCMVCPFGYPTWMVGPVFVDG